MKRKLFSFIFTICMIVPCLAICVGCNLDLSHKHLLDDFGVCTSCKKDVSNTIDRENNLEYISDEVYCNTNNYTYFKFVANGEDFATIYVEEITAQVEDYTVRFYDAERGSFNSYYLTHMSGENSYFYDGELTVGKTYYICFKARQAGTVRITVSPFIES